MQRFILHLFATAVIMMAVPGAQAQQQSLYTQFQFNKLAINPAYAGSRDATSITALYRHQWAGISGAPRTASINVHSPLRNKQFAVGLQLVNDRVGVTNATGLFADYAYRMPVGSNGKFSLGLEAGITHYDVSLTDALSQDPDDPNLQSDFTKWLPNVGAGAYYSSDRFFAGISVPRLIQNRLMPEGMESAAAAQARHYYAMAGYFFKLSSVVKLRPSVLAKYVQDAPFQAEINGSLLFVDKLWIGASYRTDASVDFNLQYDVTPQLRLGYAYDYVLGQLGDQTSGSHELFVGFDFDFDHARIVTPRNVGVKPF